MTDNPTGFPRPVLRRNGRNTPVPWVGAEGPATGKWALVDPLRAIQADREHLCIICGLPCGDDYVYGLLHGRPYEHRSPAFDVLLGVGPPAPTYGHPKCVLIAATYCPHLKRQPYPACDRDGNKLTFQQLRELAHTNKEEGTKAMQASTPEGAATITISLDIENHYELYGQIDTSVTDEVIPAPPTTDRDSDEWHDWAQDHILPFTGTGREDGNSAYFVTVTACSDPALVGEEFEFGV